MDDLQIRIIQSTDNKTLALLIRNTMAEFGVDKPGTVYDDPTTDELFDLFQKNGSIYFVALAKETILGGAGIFPSKALPQKTCELVKMYLSPESRGLGLGKRLLDKCLEFAKTFGYQQVYIETMPELTRAIGMYLKFGFHPIKGPLGSTGHYGCEVWMIEELWS
jgi:putative acetyltransferase